MTITSVALMRAMADIPFLSLNSLHALLVMIEVIVCPPTSMVIWASNPSTLTCVMVPCNLFLPLIAFRLDRSWGTDPRAAFRPMRCPTSLRGMR